MIDDFSKGCECIEDATGLPKLMADVIRSKGSVASLEALYAFINEWAANRTADAQAADLTSDAIARSQIILALVDEYMDKPSTVTRGTLRGALFTEFESLLAALKEKRAMSQNTFATDDSNSAVLSSRKDAEINALRARVPEPEGKCQAEFDLIANARCAAPQAAKGEGLSAINWDALVESMCLTMRHDYGLERTDPTLAGVWCFGAGMEPQERDALRRQMQQLVDNNVKPAIAAYLRAAGHGTMKCAIGEFAAAIDAAGAHGCDQA